MNRIAVAACCIAFAFACKSDDGPAAPVVNGSWMIFHVTDSTPAGPIEFDLKLSFTQRGDVFDLSFEHDGSDPKVPPMPVNRKLIPDSNVIGPFSLGRLWLEPQGRQIGKRTPCGAVTKEQKYRTWQVYRIDGLCGTNHGSRYYDKTTGMLVGFMFSGGIDRSAYVRDAG